jgi:hypothetical protein
VWDAGSGGRRGRDSRADQIRGGGRLCSKTPGRLEHATGILVPPGDARATAEAVVGLLTNTESRRLLSEHAVRDVRERFDLNQQIECYLAWYRTIIDDWHRHAMSDSGGPARATGECRLAMD